MDSLYIACVYLSQNKDKQQLKRQLGNYLTRYNVSSFNFPRIRMDTALRGANIMDPVLPFPE